MKPFYKLSRLQLRKLYSDFVIYRDNECNGRAKIDVKEYYKLNNKKYNEQANTCKT